jgi:hypothetical protein
MGRFFFKWLSKKV